MQPLWETVWWFLKKFIIGLWNDLSILLLGVHKRELKAGVQIQRNVYSNIIYNSQKGKNSSCQYVSADELIKQMC